MTRILALSVLFSVMAALLGKDASAQGDDGSARAFPDEPFRAKQPSPAKLRPLQLPSVTRFGLPNGIDVYLVERHQLPTISLQLVLDGGAIDDPGGKEGLASMAMTLLTDGTEKLDKIAFREALADVASNVSSFAFAEQQGVSMSTLTRNLDATLDLWADALLRPGLRQDEFDRDVKQRLNSLLQTKGSPAGVAGRLTDNVAYGPEHPYGRIFTEASTRALTLDDCKTYLASRLKPEGSKLFVVGDITRQQIESKVGARLAAWKGKPAASVAVGAPRPRPGSVFFVDIPNAPQSVIRLVHTGPARNAKDYFPTYIMSSILGGGFASRINMNIREKHGYAYGARGGFDYARHVSSFVGSASVKSDKTKESVQEMLNEIRGIRSGDVSDEELAREKEGSILGLPAQFATGGQIIGTFQNLLYFGLPLDYYASYIPKVQSVTKDQVRKAAERNLQPERLQLLVVGDAKTVLPRIRELLAEKQFAGDVQMLDADGQPVTTSSKSGAAGSGSGAGR